MNLMLIKRVDAQVSACGPIAGGRRSGAGRSGVSKSADLAPLRRALGGTHAEWMASDLSKLDLLVVQIDGIHMTATWCWWRRSASTATAASIRSGFMEGATENTAVVQALIDKSRRGGLDPAVPRLFIVDGSKALSKAIRRSFGREALIQRCQIHKARNIMERLPKPMHAAVRRVLRQAWELDDAEKG